MEDWIRDHFKVERAFPYEDFDYIVWDRDGTEMMLPLPLLLDYCDGITTPLSYNKLVKREQEKQWGWEKIFSDWKENDYIK